MIKIKYSGVILLILILHACNSQVTMKSLLEEMADRQQLTYFPEKSYSHLHFSSYDRASVSPEKEGWFANIDRSNFLRVEENDGRREFVMVDAEGPGAIVRWFMTFYRAYDGVIRIYIDHDPLPVIEGAPNELLAGSLLSGYPFAVSVQEGALRRQEGWGYDHNLYFPIPFSRNIKITYECDLLEVLREGKDHTYYFPDVFYNIGYRAYDPKVKVESFSWKSFEKIRPVLQAARDALLTDKVHSSVRENFDKLIMPGDSLVYRFNNKNYALNHLMVYLQVADMHQALRSTVLDVSFDGHQTVWIPVGEFFGSGYMTNTHHTWMNQRTEAGSMESWYVMPFRETMVLSVANYGDQPVRINGMAGFTDYRWKDNSMYFGASWHEYHRIPARDEKGSPYDLNYIELNGKGVYAGDQITLFNNTHHWWGEGDEKIYVDGESFPSVFGTGTEDYYGYSFGRPEVFSHPFIAQPSGSGNFGRGVTVNSRHRSLDAIPFNSSIKADMELWHWDEATCMNYALSSFYYVMPGFTKNIRPDISAVRQPVAVKRGDLNCEPE